MDNLHELVQGLSQAEKRYFRLYLQRYSSKDQATKSTRLFDALIRMKLYEKETLLNKCDFIAVGQLENMKHRLYNQIMECLRAFHADKSVALTIFQLLTDYEILLHKGMYKQCLKTLRKAEKNARNYGHLYILNEVLNRMEYIVLVRLKLKNSKRLVHEIQQKRNELNAAQLHIAALKEVRVEVYNDFREQGRVWREKDRVKALEERLEELKTKKHLASSYFEIGYNIMFSDIGLCSRKGEFTKAEAYIEEYHALFAANENLIKSFVTHYVTMLNYYVIILNMCEEYDKAALIIKEMKEAVKYDPHNVEIQLLIFENAVFQELEIYLHTGQFRRGIKLIETNLEKIDSIRTTIHNVNGQSKYYRVALAYFGAGEYKVALQWVNKILNFDQMKYRKDILSSVQMINLLIHYELGNYSLLTYSIPSVKVYLKKIDRWLPPEKELLKTLGKMEKSRNKERLFEELHDALLENVANRPLDRYAIAYFDLIAWTKAKKDNRMFGSVLSEKLEL